MPLASHLTPLHPTHAPTLHTAAGDYNDTFRWFTTRPDAPTPDAMARFVDALIARPNAQPMCVLDPDTSTPVGITALLDVDHHHRTLEIGHTWYAASARGSLVNPACKLALLTHAFDALGFERVCLKTHEHNAHSRAAIGKLGATFEGVLRSIVAMPPPHPPGTRRSTAMYSILRDEWARVREGLLARLT